MGRPQTKRLDLHGLRVHEALSLAEDAINKAVLADADQLELLHGIGQGKIKDALHKHLAGLKVVKRFALDPANPGVTRVYL